MNSVLAAFSATLQRAQDARTPLRFRGGGTKDFYGQNLTGELLDTRIYRGIVDYDPTELVITARAGTPLVDIESALAQNNQMLAFEPPHFGNGATLGGCVAAGLSGPRRQAAGAVRDYVLGAALMNHRGDVLHFGGRVMKNVAGYDVSRLLAGSLGTLGLLLEVSLKVLPKPFTETTLSFRFDHTTALQQLNEWAAKPLPISASIWHNGLLHLRLSGSEVGVHAAVERLGTLEQLDGASATRLWTQVREQTHTFFNQDTPLWRLSVPSTVAPLPLTGEQFIEWGGALRWFRGDIAANAIREIIARVGGHATLFRARDKTAGVFATLPPTLLRIHRALKTEFDPAGVFNAGRLYAEF